MIIIPQDKANHFIYGNAIAIVAVVATTFLAPEFRQFAGIAASTVAGVLKELADAAMNKWRGASHGVELMDALATAAGGIATVQI